MKRIAITVFRNNWTGTARTLADLLAQDVAPLVLAIDNGGSAELRREFEQYCGAFARVLPWHHKPALPALAATWNAALRFVWEAGAEEALVCNNDVALHPATMRILSEARAATGALFITAVNAGHVPDALEAPDLSAHGGPDFSCYLISREGHAEFPFDEQFIPAFAEDVDMHRRYMLAGCGNRIFSLNVPYEHTGGGSQTLKHMSAEERDATERQINEVSRAYYAAKWGGGVNAEKWLLPFNMVQDLACSHTQDVLCHGCPACPEGCVTTPQLQAHGCGGSAIARG